MEPVGAQKGCVAMMMDIAQGLTSRWWTFLLRGIIALALAAFAFLQPGTLSTVLVYIVAAYFLISGLLALWAGISVSGSGSWWVLVLIGLAEGALGIIMLTRPGAGPLALAYLVAIWAFTTGLMEISGAIALRDAIRNEFWWILLGLVTIALAIYIIIQPDIGILALVYTIGIYAVIAGISLIAFAFRLRGAGKDIEKLRVSSAGATR